MSVGGIERHVRRVVARRLGIAPSVLDPTVSLRDDLATDEQTMLDLVLAVESRLGVRMSERMLDDVRTYGELVTATIDAVRIRRSRLEWASGEGLAARVRIVAPDARAVERSGRLTPYLVEAIVDDARRGGPGTQVAITVTEPATDERLRDLRRQLEPLDRRGVSIRIGRGPETGGLLAGSASPDAR